MDGHGSMTLAAQVLSASSTLVDGINAGATVGEIATHLGVTKQAASQLVDELIGTGYVQRRPQPTDARARLIVLTDRACTRAAEQAADTVRGWAGVLGDERVAAPAADLARVAPVGRLRPAW